MPSTVALGDNKDGGDNEIPPGLWAVVMIEVALTFGALGIVWYRGLLGYEEVEADRSLLFRSPANPPKLALYRFGVTIYTFIILCFAVGEGGYPYRYFTIWNYTTLVIVFALLSLQHVFTYTPNWLRCVTWTLFQLELTNAIFLDLVFWTLLFPPSYYKILHGHFFITVNVHALNAVWIMGELALNSVVVAPGQLVWVLVYTMTYVMVTWGMYTSGDFDTMPYNFLDVSKPFAPLMYIGATIALLAVFYSMMKLSELKDRWQKGAGTASRGGYERIN